MRTRSLADAFSRKTSLQYDLVVRSNDPPYDVLQHFLGTEDSATAPYILDQSVIKDMVDSKYFDYKAQVNRFRESIRISRMNKLGGKKLHVRVKALQNLREFPRAPHFCNHVKTSFKTGDAVTINFEDHHLAGSTGYLSWTADGLTLLNALYTLPSGESGFLDFVKDLDSASAVSALPPIDWVSLYDKYTNSCQAFIPASFLIGEDLVESDVFVDALKIMINPASAIRSLLRAIPKLGVKLNKHSSMGDVVHHVVKSGADQTLFGAFGVRPAINDLLDVLDAHKKVSSRMAYLRQHVDRFVPVRVRSATGATVSDSIPTGPFTTMSAFKRVESSTRVGTMGCWARVRHDLTFSATWSAYLQYFGVDRIIGLGWELLPFSFVVDWFLNTKHVINYFTRLNTGGPFCEFRSFTCSEKTETTTKLCLTPGALPTSGSMICTETAPFDIGSFTESNYLRSLEVPSDLSPLSFTGFNSFQIVTGAALFLQRVL